MNETITQSLNGELIAVPRRLRLVVVAGPDKGLHLEVGPGTYVIGTGRDCDVRLTDESVSRRHLEVIYTLKVVHVRDLDSKNGTFFRGARITYAQVGANSLFRLGRTELRMLEPEPSRTTSQVTSRFIGDGLVGRSAAMAEVHDKIRRVAHSDATVLITGESGTGKEVVAHGIHRASPRRDQPFRVVDLAATTGSLLESELFGHKKGSFTGAFEDRAGAFVDAHRGTVFLDEIGELDASLQPRLLRAVERRLIKPIGESRYRSVDVRILAATNRDLRAEMAEGGFRADLYHRLAVVVIELPPLRDRRDDIPLLVEHFLEQLHGPDHPEVSYSTMQSLVAYAWPGNVRELRNAVERACALSTTHGSIDIALAERHASDPGLATPDPALREAAGPIDSAGDTIPGLDVDIDPQVPFKEAKSAVVTEWERKYLDILMKRYDGNVSLAARRSGIARVHLHRLLKKHGLA